jgi:hypothetical protein
VFSPFAILEDVVPSCDGLLPFVADISVGQIITPFNKASPRKEPRLRAFENRVLWRIFQPEREKVAGGWRRLHNEELRSLYS